MKTIKELKKGNRNELKRKLKKRYPKLTNDDLLLKRGKDHPLLKRSPTEFDESKEEVEQVLSNIYI